MPKCDLQIVFDRADCTYKTGERITGTVQVTVNEDCECRKLILARQWCASGQGESDQGTPEEEQVIFSGAWRAGQIPSYPFEIESPRGPISYHGALFNVGWQILAAADAFGIDATSAENFVLVSGSPTEDARMETLEERPPQLGGPFEKAPSGYSGGCMQLFAALFGAVALFVGLPCLVIGVLNLITIYIPVSLPISVPTGPMQSIFLIVVGGLFTTLGGRVLITLLRGAMARTKIGPVQFEVSPTTLRRGGTVTCTVRLQPRGSMELSEATANLVATELVVGRRGDSDSDIPPTWRQVIHESRAQITTARAICGGESTLLTATLTIPPDAPCTFSGGNNRLVWTVAVELKLKGLPDWARTVPITIHP